MSKLKLNLGIALSNSNTEQIFNCGNGNRYAHSCIANANNIDSSYAKIVSSLQIQVHCGLYKAKIACYLPRSGKV